MPQGVARIYTCAEVNYYVEEIFKQTWEYVISMELRYD